MPNNQEQRAPGLRLWIMLLIAAAGIVSLALVLPSKERQENAEIARWLQREARLKNGRTTILVLGTSLTGCGLDSAVRLERKIQQLGGKKAQVVKVWKLNASPETFAALSEGLSNLRPDVVVVESNTLFYAFVKNEGWPKYVQRLRDFIFRKKDDYEPDSKPVIVRRSLAELEGFRTGMIDTAQLEGFREMLGKWSAGGSRIVLLNFPLESSLESRKWTGGDTAAYLRNEQYISRNIPVQTVREKELWGQGYFIDHAHMNARGRQRQSDLFCRLVASQPHHP